MVETLDRNFAKAYNTGVHADIVSFFIGSTGETGPINGIPFNMRDTGVLLQDTHQFHFKFDATTGQRLNQATSTDARVTDVLRQITGEMDSAYTIRWHLPYENWLPFRPDSAPFTEDVPGDRFTIETPGYAIANGSIHCTWTYDTADWADFNQAGFYVFAVIGGLSSLVPVWGPEIAAMAGILALNFAQPKHDERQCQFQ